MSGENDETPTPPKQVKKPGPATLIFKATEVAEEKARQSRAEERVRDKEQEAAKDIWADKALASESKRADAAEAALATKDENWKSALKDQADANASALAGKDRTIRFQYAIIALLIGAIVVFGGYKVSGGIEGVGEVNMGGAAVETK